MGNLFFLFFGLLAMSVRAYGDEAKDHRVFHESFDGPVKGELYELLANGSHREVVEAEGTHGSRALKVTYEGGERGSERVTAKYKLGERGLEYTLNYDVKFDHDFQFVKGGKLHGLGPDSPITGGKAMRPDGWSARVTFKEEGKLKSYLYSQNKDGKYGASMFAEKFRFEKGKYYSVFLHIKLNTHSSESDGFAHIYIDGDRVIKHDGIQFRGEEGDRTLVSTFLFSTFHGGHEPHWAPRDSEGNYTDVHAYFDNIAVYRGKRIRNRLAE